MKNKRKTALALWKTRISRKYAATLILCYLFAAILWYAVCAIVPYTATVNVSAEQNARLDRNAFSATQEEIDSPIGEKARIALMPTSEDSFVYRLRLIEEAKQTIEFMVYESYDDVGAEYFYTALFRAAERGVTVRMLVDGKLGRLNGTLKPLEDILSNHNNIELYYFNTVNVFRPAGLFVLCHDKVTVIDDEKMIIGGANMGMGAYTANYDMEALVIGGDSVMSAKNYISGIITSGMSKRRKTAKKRDISVMNGYETRLEKYLESKTGGTDYERCAVAANKITYLTNPINDGKKAPIIYQALLNLAQSSKQTTIVTPYALLTDGKIARLRQIAADSERFTIITNSLYNTRNAAYAVYYNRRDKYLSENIELYEFQAANQIHAKIYSFDGRYSVIGSFNLDERSAHIDTESVIIVDSREFNAILTDYIETQLKQNSLRVGMNNEYIPSETVQAIAPPRSKQNSYKLYAVMEALIILL